MGIQKTQSKDTAATKAVMKNIILNALCNIQNGCITVVKQDNIVIQVNVNESIILDKKQANRNLSEEA